MDTIYDVLGFGTAIGATAIAGRETIRTAQAMKNRNTRLADIAKIDRSDVVKSLKELDPSIYANSKDLNLDELKATAKYVDINNKIESTYGANTYKRFQRIMEANNLFYEMGGMQYGSGGTSVSLKLNNMEGISIGMISENGTIRRASSGNYAKNSFTPNYFMRPEITSKVMSGEIKAGSELFGNAGNFMSFNEAKMHHITNVLESLGTNNHPITVQKAIQSAVIDFDNQFIKHTRNTNPMVEAVQRHMMVPMFEGQTSISDIYSPHNKDAYKFGTKIYAMSRDMKDSLIVDPTSFRSAADISSGLMTYPMAPFEGRELGLLNEYGLHGYDKKLNQGLLRETVTATGRNFDVDKTMFVGLDNKIFDELAFSGRGNDGMIINKIGDEGFYAAADAMDRMHFDRQSLEIGTDKYIAEPIVSLIDDIGEKVPGFERNELAALIERDPEEIDRALKEIANERWGSDEFRLDKYLREKKLGGFLAGSETGDIRIGDEKRILRGIGLTPGGLVFDTEVMGNAQKEWFSIKGLSMERVKNMKSLAFETWALNKTAQEDGLSQKKVAQLIKQAREGNDPRPQQILDSMIYKQNKYRREFNDVKFITHQNLASSEGTKGITESFTAGARTSDDLYLTTEQITGDKLPDNSQPRLYMKAASFAENEAFRGYDMRKPMGVNRIMVDRLNMTGQTTAANLVASKFDRETVRNLSMDMAPVMYKDFRGGKDYVGLKLGGDIGMTEIDDILNMNAADGRNKIAAIAEKYGHNVSDKTRFYIDISERIANRNLSESVNKIPISFSDSGYTTILNNRGLAEPGEEIRKMLTRETGDILRAADRGFITNADVSKYGGAVGKTLFDQRSFANTLTRDATLSQIQHARVLDSAEMGNIIGEADKMGRKDKVMGVLGEFGLLDENKRLIDLDKTNLHGYSSEKYNYIAKKSDAYKRIFAETGDEALALKRLRQEKLLEIVTRNPSYALEATTTSRMMDLEMLTKHLDFAMGRTSSGKALSANFNNTAVYVSAATKALTMSDFDDDQFLSLLVRDEKMTTQMLSEAKSWRDMDPIVRHTYLGGDSKGGLKSMGTIMAEAAKEANVMERASAEKQFIGKIYNAAIPYSPSFNPEAVMAFGASGKVDGMDKALMMEHFLTRAPELAIGGKNIGSIAAGEKMTEMLSTSDSKRARELFREVVTDLNTPQTGEAPFKIAARLTEKLPDGVDNMFDLIEDAELEKFFGSGRKFLNQNQQVVDLIGSKKHTLEQLRGISAMIKNRGYGGSGSSNLMIDSLFEELASTRSKTRTGINTYTDIVQDVGKKLMKNKAFLGVGAAAMVGGLLLRSSDNAQAHQEVREESRPGRTTPNGAPAIDPPDARVYKPGVQNYKLSVRGVGPGNVSPHALRSGMSTMGLSPTNTVIDRSSSLDSEYINELQNEDKLNKWNLG